jgi:hypothetical protein
LDWDWRGRSQRIDLINASGSVIGTRQVSGFTGGQYLVFTFSGHVQVRFTRLSGPNCVLSGVFLGGAPTSGVSVTVSPATVTLSIGQTQQFSAAVAGSSNTSVKWSISPSAGSITSSGLYTAAKGGGGIPPKLGGCNVFPGDNVWNTPVDGLPVAGNSSAYINTIGAGIGVHPDFSAGGGGIPFNLVPGSQPKVGVRFNTGASESDPGPYPVPANAVIESGVDRHVLVVDTGACVLYEMYYAFPQSDGTWAAYAGAVFDLKSNGLRPDTWTSADAAGLPILPGLVRYDEVASGEIRHAIRFTAPRTQRAYTWPARHYASSNTSAAYPPMGQRFRLKASFDISPYPADVQVILRAMKKYGIILADNGSAWYITGAPDPRWNDETLHSIGGVHGSDFEAVDVTSLKVGPDSAQVNTGSTSTVKVTATSVYDPSKSGSADVWLLP